MADEGTIDGVEATEKDISPTIGVHKKTDRLKDALQVLGLTLLAAFFLRTFVVEAFRIPTSSMGSTLLVGDFLLVNKLIYGPTTPRTIPFTDIALPWFSLPAIRSPRTGDIVVFVFPGFPDQVRSHENVSYVKRCIGTPGDTVSIVDKVVFVNGRRLRFPEHAQFDEAKTIPAGSVDSRIFPRGSLFNRDNYGPLVVPKKGDVIHLSDLNFAQWKTFIVREGHSVDQDKNGEIVIDGAVATEYIVEKDYFFVMGDNRDDSLDSRFWGFVADDLLIGKVLMLYWSWDETRETESIADNFSKIRWDRIGMVVQ